MVGRPTRNAPAARSTLKWLRLALVGLEQGPEEQPGQKREQECSAGPEVCEVLLDVACDHKRGYEPGQSPGRWIQRCPPHCTRDPWAEEERLESSDAEAGDGAHHDQVCPTDAVIDEGRTDSEAGSHPNARRYDPQPRNERSKRQPLCCSDDPTRDQAAGERRGG